MLSTLTVIKANYIIKSLIGITNLFFGNEKAVKSETTFLLLNEMLLWNGLICKDSEGSKVDKKEMACSGNYH